MLFNNALTLDNFVQVAFGLVIAALFAALWRRSMVSKSSRSKSAGVSGLVGLGLCGLSAALLSNAYTPPKSRKFLPVLIELIGTTSVAVLILASGAAVLWGTYLAVSENEA